MNRSSAGKFQDSLEGTARLDPFLVIRDRRVPHYVAVLVDDGRLGTYIHGKCVARHLTS